MNAEDQLKQLEALEDNWDGYAGYAPTSKVIEKVRKIIETFKNKEILLTPTPAGTIEIVWVDESGTEWSLEIGENNNSLISND